MLHMMGNYSGTENNIIGMKRFPNQFVIVPPNFVVNMSRFSLMSGETVSNYGTGSCLANLLIPSINQTKLPI